MKIIFTQDYQGHLTAHTGRFFQKGECADLGAKTGKALVDAGRAKKAPAKTPLGLPKLKED